MYQRAAKQPSRSGEWMKIFPPPRGLSLEEFCRKTCGCCRKLTFSLWADIDMSDVSRAHRSVKLSDHAQWRRLVKNSGCILIHLPSTSWFWWPRRAQFGAYIECRPLWTGKRNITIQCQWARRNLRSIRHLVGVFEEEQKQHTMRSPPRLFGNRNFGRNTRSSVQT